MREEAEIEKFVPKEYWTVETKLSREASAFKSKLHEYEGEKIKQFSITDEQKAFEIRDKLLLAGAGAMIVSRIEKKQRKRNPAPPFITSTLQQEAVRRLGFTAQRTMRVAQQFMRGISIDEETVGLSTYARTDSVSLSEDAVRDLRGFVREKYAIIKFLRLLELLKLSPRMLRKLMKLFDQHLFLDPQKN